ncbi:MAG: HlyD family efflux transporter periplasmic adaptor subunit [Nitrospiraceae bacterium]|nr:MAG: HlyD family efflux transporter periplasmic adaptor subunit [Nitrospiraceae bacterium]
MKKIVIIAGLVVLAVVAILLVTRFNNTADEDAIAVSGNVEVTEVDLGFKLPGRITTLFAEEGQKVSKGDRLGLIDSAELESRVMQNRAYLEETKARLAELKAGARPQELEQAKAEVKAAEVELERARKDFDRADALFRMGAISAQQMDTAKKTYDVLVSRHRKAMEFLSLLKEGSRREVITAAESRVRQAEASLAASEEALKDTVISAPVSGVILRKNAEAGETVFAGMPVYTIADLSVTWIKVYVKEEMLGHVKLGQKAEVKTDSYPDKKYEGTVTHISSEAEFTPKNIQTQEERVKLVFGMKVSVKNENDELKPGMPADVKIILIQ